MKIAVTSTGPTLDAQIDPRFGRCRYFVFVETDDMSFEAVENPNLTLGGGAGIQSGQFVASQGAKTILTGNCGPNAFQTLSASGMEVIVGVSGTVREAVEAYKRGRFSASGTANVQSHFGMGAGMGRGMGMGRGTPAPPSAPMSKEQELETLKQQSEALRAQADRISERIRELKEQE